MRLFFKPLMCASIVFGMSVIAKAEEVAKKPTEVKKVEATAAQKEKPKATEDKNMHPVLEMKTSLGTMEIELDGEKAPETVKNFLSYVDDKFYDGVIFHRVIQNFMIQGGGFGINADKIPEEKPTKKPIINESKNGLKNVRGTLAMARTSDPNSATAQFFINVTDNSFLDYPNAQGSGYAVFGRVTKGLEILDKIKSTKTGVREMLAKTGGPKTAKQTFEDVPMTDVVIQSVRVVSKKSS